MRIALFVGRLAVGGTERQFALLADGLAGLGHEVRLFTIYPGEGVDGVRARALCEGKSGGRAGVAGQLLRAGERLGRHLRDWRPDVCHSALEMTNLLAFAATRNLPSTKLVWGIRAGDDVRPWARRLPWYAGRALAPRVPLVISNSHSALAFHRAHGWRFRRAIVIPNGMDTERFSPPSNRGIADSALRTPHSALARVGIVGRLTPVKDHPTFLRAAAILRARRGEVRFVIVGDGEPAYRSSLTRLSADLGLGDCVRWTGARADMPAVYAGLDVCVCCSTGESFPNVVAESMACGVPCVSTRVGDVANIVGDERLLVRPGDPTALAEAIARALEGDAPTPEQCRERIVREFSVDRMVRRTEAALRATVA